MQNNYTDPNLIVHSLLYPWAVDVFELVVQVLPCSMFHPMSSDNQPLVRKPKA